MKYSDILFEKTCVNRYIQKHCTVYKMLSGGKEEGLRKTDRQGDRSAERMMGCKPWKGWGKGRGDGVSFGSSVAWVHVTERESVWVRGETGTQGVQNVSRPTGHQRRWVEKEKYCSEWWFNTFYFVCLTQRLKGKEANFPTRPLSGPDGRKMGTVMSEKTVLNWAGVRSGQQKEERRRRYIHVSNSHPDWRAGEGLVQ